MGAALAALGGRRLWAAGAACAAVAAAVTFEPRLIADAHLARLAAIVSVMAFIIVPVIHFYQTGSRRAEEERRELEEKRRNLEERAGVARDLYQELRGVLVAIEGEEHPEDVFSIEHDGRSVTMVTRHLNTSAYEGAVSSGRILLLPQELRELLADDYSMIKTHNRHARAVDELEARRGSGDVKTEFPLYELVARIEQKLIAKLPTTLQKLREFEAGLAPGL